MKNPQKIRLSIDYGDREVVFEFDLDEIKKVGRELEEGRGVTASKLIAIRNKGLKEKSFKL